MTFKAVPQTQIKYLSIQIREDAKSNADNVTWTPLQKIQTVVAEKKEMESRKEVVNAASMSKAFMANIRFAASSEKFSDAFIDAAYPPLVF